MPATLRPALVTPDCDFLFHRGFELRLRATEDTFAFEVGDCELTLHASAATFHSPHAAERAGRRFVDDALGAFDAASARLAA